MNNQEFPKLYEPKEREAIWREFWKKENIYRFDEHSDRPIFSIDTPPPYVSAEHLHVGHIMSYSQAEFVVRFKRMKGFNVFYPMGFDDNGLPTERYVEKKYKIDKNKITRSEFIKRCLEESKILSQNYKNLWTLLGVSVDWSKTYDTIDKHSQKISQESFIDLYKKGLIFKRSQPMHWCIHCQTALAQADLEDKEEKGFLNFIEFKTKDNEPLLIATTRPELIPACVALFYNPQDKRYQHLKDKKAIVPILNYEIPILEDEDVDKNFGTGLMMVCTWGDIDDIKKWERYKLESRSLFDEKGIITKIGGKYKGISLINLKKLILQDLKDTNLLKKQEEIVHTLNAHERCGSPVEFVLTKQWFIKLLRHKQAFLKRGRELKWFPKRMEKIYENWINGLKWDWCISRQRYYGVPIPVWHCKDCKEIILANEKDLPVDPFEDNPPFNLCQRCGSKDIVGEKDVMDTWMTSSLTPIIGAKLVKDKNLQEKLYPASLRPQAFEIIRTWLFYTIVKSHYHHNHLPFKDAMISGHGLDEQGRKISKRLGNYTEPIKIIEKYGADALRYWATGAGLGENLRYNEDEIKKGKRTITKIFNAAKFAFAHLINFNPVPIQGIKLEPIDRWVLNEMVEVIEKATHYFEQYEYAKARNIIDWFFWHVFTDNYLEFIKYRLYDEDSQDQSSKQAARQTLYHCLLTIIKLYGPILPYITEEIYQKIFKDFEKDKSVHITKWPDKKDYQAIIDPAIKNEFQEVLVIVEKIRKFKSENNLSMGKELEEFQIKASKNLFKYKDLIERGLRVKNLIINV